MPSLFLLRYELEVPIPEVQSALPSPNPVEEVVTLAVEEPPVNIPEEKTPTLMIEDVLAS